MPMGVQDLVLQLVLASAVLAAVCTAQSCPTFQNGCSCRTYTSYAFGLRGIFMEVRCNNLGLTSFPVLPAEIQGTVGRLSLRNNDIERIEPGAFSTTTQLRELVLSGNNLTEITDYMFANLTQLRYLYLSDNHIEYIEPGAFSTTTQLITLSLDGNNLSEIADYLFANLTQLQRLDLHDNDIGYIEVGSFSTTTRLGGLRLDRNNLTEIPDNLFANLTQLQVLSLQRNNLMNIPDNLFANLAQLDRLFLYHNHIGYIEPGTFSTTTQLRVLRLYGNDLTEIPDNLFENLTQLEELYLYDNHIGYIESGTFSTTTQLTELYLHDNDIGYIEPGTFSTTTQLTTLRLNGNDLTEISDNLFANLTQLQLLTLNGNDLTEISDNLFANLTQLQVLDLSSNPLHCDCRLSWIPSYRQTHPYLYIILWGTCDAPESVRGRSVASLQEEEFVCGPVRNLSVSFTTTSIDITWEEPEMLNGIVTYNISVSGVDLENNNIVLSITTTVNTTDYVLQHSVEPFSEYTVTVVPVTSAGGGNTSTTSFTTPEGKPSAPLDFLLRVNGASSVLNASWRPPNRTNGVITTYTVYCRISNPQTDEEQPQNDFMPFITTSGSDDVVFSLSITDLSHFTYYDCFVTAATIAGEGNASNTDSARTDEDTMLFQLQWRGVGDCFSWVVFNTESKVVGIASVVAEETEQLCQCGFTTEHITEGGLQCLSDSNEVTFRARLHQNERATTEELIHYVEQWVERDVSVLIQGLRLTVDSTCQPVAINSFDDLECELPTTTPTPLPTTAATAASSDNTKLPATTPTSTAALENTGAIVGGVVGGILGVVFISITITLIVILLLRSCSAKPDVQHSYETNYYIISRK